MRSCDKFVIMSHMGDRRRGAVPGEILDFPAVAAGLPPVSSTALDTFLDAAASCFARFGVGHTTVPDIACPCTWQKYVNVPAALKVWSNVPLDCGEPLLNELSVAVTVCELTPAQVQWTVSPTLMVTDAGM